jgi:hypothetical protein
MAIRFLNTILSGSLKVSGSYTLPNIDTGSTGVIGQIGINGEVPHFYNSNGWQAVSGSKVYVAPPPSATIEYLVIAGGGGGSSGIGNGNGTGGGGAGGMLSSSLADIESGSKFTVTVGAGGNGGSPSTYAGRSSAQRGTDGTGSSIASAAGTSFTTVTAIGGGSGGRYYGDNTGNDGGSGGGGASYSGAGGSGTTGQGNDGGVATPSGNSTYRGGGGGGKSAAGATGATSGNGGAGQASKITGTAVNYAGGGGGGTYTAAGGSGGTGGGGAGSNQGNTAGSGTTNTGGGGGGGGWPGSSNSTGGQGGSGGSGVVVLGFPTASLSASGSQQRSFFGDRVAHIITTTSTFTLLDSVTHTHSTLDIFGDSSCVALYQLDGNANDKSGNYNGTATSITYTQGYINDAAVFGGSSKIEIGASNNFASNKVTISFWFKPTSTISNYKILFSNYTTGAYTDGFLNMSRNTDGTLELGIMAGSGWFFRKTSNSVFTVGTLKHYVVVMDNTESAEGDKVTMYVNGEVVTHANNTNSGTPSGNWLNTSTVLNIGNWVHATGYGESGEFDQIRIFNKALSASEITTLYNE